MRTFDRVLMEVVIKKKIPWSWIVKATIVENVNQSRWCITTTCECIPLWWIEWDCLFKPDAHPLPFFAIYNEWIWVHNEDQFDSLTWRTRKRQLSFFFLSTGPETFRNLFLPTMTEHGIHLGNRMYLDCLLGDSWNKRKLHNYFVHLYARPLYYQWCH